jgi:hypothetical protein
MAPKTSDTTERAVTAPDCGFWSVIFLVFGFWFLVSIGDRTFVYIYLHFFNLTLFKVKPEDYQYRRCSIFTETAPMRIVFQ